MTLKHITHLIILITLIGIAGAGEIVTEDNSTVYIYGAVDKCIYMSSVNNEKTNYYRTVCINATVIEGEISISGYDDYELEYEFTADISETSYVQRSLIIKQELISSHILWGKDINRSLTLDGVLIGKYTLHVPFMGKVKKNTVYFDLIDDNIRFGDDVISNTSLAFTQLDYTDQQEYLPNVSKQYPSFPIYHKYISVGLNKERSAQLTGLTGIIYNVFGDNILTKIPLVGNAVASFGKSMQALLFMPLTIIQFTFNFFFTFISLITNNWWYGLMLLEIFCMFPALKHNNYSDIISVYISTHVKIITFLWEVVILNLINLIFRIIEIVRNMFRV